MSKWGKCLGYVSTPCANCNRIRLEKYENGKHRCEKCEWSPEENNYVDWREIYPFEESEDTKSIYKHYTDAGATYITSEPTESEDTE